MQPTQDETRAGAKQALSFLISCPAASPHPHYRVTAAPLPPGIVPELGLNGYQVGLVHSRPALRAEKKPDRMASIRSTTPKGMLGANPRSPARFIDIPFVQVGQLLAKAKRAPSYLGRPSDRDLDQFYTRPHIARLLYCIFKKYIDTRLYQMVEPSAGEGAFFKLLRRGSLGCDLEPKCSGVWKADFLKVEIASDRDVAIIGNPPFCRNMALKFLKHAANQPRVKVIAFILPKTFKKMSVQNKVDRNFRLLHEEPVPVNAFLFRGEVKDVPTVFQIWVRCDYPRELHKLETSHPDFEFVKSGKSDFAIRRIGAQAGHIRHEFPTNSNSYYLIRAKRGKRGKVQAIMAQLDFASVAAYVAGPPSLSKPEVIHLYREWVRLHSAV